MAVAASLESALVTAIKWRHCWKKNLIMRVLIKNKYVIDFFATVVFYSNTNQWSFFSDKAPDLTKAAWAFPLVG